MHDDGISECVGYGEGRYLLSFVGGGFSSPAYTTGNHTLSGWWISGLGYEAGAINGAPTRDGMACMHDDGISGMCGVW